MNWYMKIPYNVVFYIQREFVNIKPFCYVIKLMVNYIIHIILNISTGEKLGIISKQKWHCDLKYIRQIIYIYIYTYIYI